MLFAYRDASVELDPEQRSAVPAAVAAWCNEMDARALRLEGHVPGPLTETHSNHESGSVRSAARSGEAAPRAASRMVGAGRFELPTSSPPD